MTSNYSEDQTNPHSENPLQFIRSQKLRELFIKKPSYLRSLTPDESYSVNQDLHRSNPLSLKLPGLELNTVSQFQKLAPQTHRENRSQDKLLPNSQRKLARSRSSQEFEDLLNVQKGAQTPQLADKKMKQVKSPENIKFPTEAKTPPPMKNMAEWQREQKKFKNTVRKENSINENDKTKSLPNVEKDDEFHPKEMLSKREKSANNTIKHLATDDSLNKDNSIGNIIDLMEGSPQNPEKRRANRNEHARESIPLSSVPSDDGFGVLDTQSGWHKHKEDLMDKVDMLGTPSLLTPENARALQKEKLASTQATGGVLDSKESSNKPVHMLIDLAGTNPETAQLSTKETVPRRQMTFDPKSLALNNLNAAKRISSPITFKNAAGQGNLLSSPSSLSARGEVISSTSACRFHPSNMINYICTKENCGELLCPLCLYEHQKNKHIGQYETINSFYSEARQRLTRAHTNMLGTIEQIVSLQAILSDKSNFDIKIVEDINRIEAGILKTVKQFFDNIREEFTQDLFFDHLKVSDNLNSLHYDLNVAIENLGDDLSKIAHDNATADLSLFTHIVQKGYINSPATYKKTLNEIDYKVKQFLKTNQETEASKKLFLEVDPYLKTKITNLLSENFNIIQNPSPNVIYKLSRPSNEEAKTVSTPHLGANKQGDSFISNEKAGSSLNDVDRNHRGKAETQRGRNVEEDKDNQSTGRSRTTSPFQGQQGRNMGEDYLKMLKPSKNTPISKGGQGQQGSNYFINKKLTDNITNKVLEIYNNSNAHNVSAASFSRNVLQEKDLDIQTMKFLLEYMERFYGTSKIKILDPTFFARLFNIDKMVDFSDFGRRELVFENVSEDLQVDGNKGGRCIFTSYEKVFMITQIQNSQWILVEIRSNPKVIILYDFLGKFAKTKFSENLFTLVLEIIRKEFNEKLGLNPENYLWEKKVASQPMLIVKNSFDTGLLAVKVVSNYYQNKEFTSPKVTLNEINLTRKKLEKIFKMYDEKKNHDKFVPI